MKEIDSHFNHATKFLLTHQARRQYIHPHDAAIYKVKFFSDYIDNPDDSFVPLDYNASEPEIRRFVETQLAVKKYGLFKILLDEGLLPREVNRKSDPDQYLELAIAVFRCLSCFQPCVGWEEAVAHLHSRREKWSAGERYNFCKPAYQALRSMVDVLGLGSESLGTLTHTDLDNLNRRFVCKTCTLRKDGGTYSLPSLTWRECLRHAVGATLHVPEFDVLTSSLTPHLLACEDPFPPPSQPVWGCLHCVSYGEPPTKAGAIHHNCKTHNIANPVENVDFSFIHTPKFPKRGRFLVGLEENANQRCLRCPSGTYKLWTNKDGDLSRHLLDAHGIKLTDLIEGVDWERLEVVEDDSWIVEAMNNH
ncbi:hypothetical protein BDN70DRAFT_926812 [Pholiota conissans]|uniref:Uncharacterized protein n=1 Tax=Pholiota conissans TaxID=109636 RepID=A0A9P6D7Y0_9AGAR|nr:hypothetical protein BDN70DRAFT_926812 [Pholiota conissans]